MKSNYFSLKSISQIDKADVLNIDLIEHYINLRQALWRYILYKFILSKLYSNMKMTSIARLKLTLYYALYSSTMSSLSAVSQRDFNVT